MDFHKYGSLWCELPGIKVKRGITALSPGVNICAGLDQDLHGAQVVVGAGKVEGSVHAETALLGGVNVVHLPRLDHGPQAARVADAGEL